MEIKLEEETSLENIYSTKKQRCFIIRQEYSKIVISLFTDTNYIYELFKNKEKVSSNIFFAFIDYIKKDNSEIILNLYNIYGKENNNSGNNINYLLKLKRMIIFNRNLLNPKNIFKEMAYILINSIFIINSKFNALKTSLNQMTLIY